MATPAANLGGKNAAQSAKAWSMADLPIARHQLANARALLAAKFAEMAAPADARRYHGLGPVTEAEEASVESSLASIQEALDNFAVWSQAEQAATPPRYLQHCKDASDRVARLQDNRKALAECRRLLERHTDASSRPKFLNQLEGVARDSGVSFFSMEDGSTVPTEATAPTHCLSGQTFVLDLHLDAAGTVSWATLQRILSDGNSVPDEASVGQPQWVELNKDISAQMASPDMENALRGQFEALQLVEQVHAAHPALAVYDHLRALEVAVEALQTDTAAAAMSEAPDYRTGFGIVKRLVQGLRFSFYESASPASELETAAALLQLDGVIPAQGTDGKARASTGLHLVPAVSPLNLRVACCAASASLLQKLHSPAASASLPAVTCQAAWRDLVIPATGAAASERAGVVVEARGRKFRFLDRSEPAAGGVEVSKVPIADATNALEALDLLRQQLVCNEVFGSCFPPPDEDEEEEEGGEGAGAKRKAAAEGGDPSGEEEERVHVVEVTAAPPSTLFLHTCCTDPAKGGGLQLTCFEIQIRPGGLASVKVHAGEGVTPPCSDAHATTLFNTTRDIPLTLSYILS